MKRYKLFLDKFNELDYNNRHKLIGSIFNLDVLVCGLVELDNRVYIKVYDGNFYYQFCFILDKYKDEYIMVSEKERIILCKVYVKSILFKYNSGEIILGRDFYEFLKMLDDGDVSYFDSFL